MDDHQKEPAGGPQRRPVDSPAAGPCRRCWAASSWLLSSGTALGLMLTVWLVFKPARVGWKRVRTLWRERTLPRWYLAAGLIGAIVPSIGASIAALGAGERAQMQPGAWWGFAAAILAGPLDILFLGTMQLVGSLLMDLVPAPASVGPAEVIGTLVTLCAVIVTCWLPSYRFHPFPKAQPNHA
ncbi:hypothetical protein [Paeniglutamicibacter cryotolerans]|uniref:Uncharacterized protein n=1 Tax=Paeniglutamicibacter cryotolerans TaxID=670079 RepID=A0A839QVQ6_9MICC|nr:hypothetical protein [Paeniglutamicibacter cryotolerans]MBB2996091.1 hypothetical protein [Paeniglutamicibacter cryotolerans]